MGNRKVNQIQKTSRPDSVWPEWWTTMSRKRDKSSNARMKGRSNKRQKCCSRVTTEGNRKTSTSSNAVNYITAGHPVHRMRVRPYADGGEAKGGSEGGELRV